MGGATGRGGGDDLNVRMARNNVLMRLGLVHEDLISLGYKEIPVFYGAGRVHTKHVRTNVGKLEAGISFVDGEYGDTEGIIILPASFVPHSQAAKKQAAYVVYMPSE